MRGTRALAAGARGMLSVLAVGLMTVAPRGARGDEPVEKAAAGPTSDPSVRRADARPRQGIIAATVGWVEYTAPFKRGLDAANRQDV